MEVFPEELALRYGFRPDQKVVNVVTFERFSAPVVQVGAMLPTDGGGLTGLASADYLGIRGDTRFSLGVDHSRSAAVLESDRDLLQSGGPPDLGAFRTLLPGTQRVAVNGLVSRPLLGNISSTLNARLEASESDTLLGRESDGGPLARDASTRSLHLGTTHSGREGSWAWTLTGRYERTSTTVFTDVQDAGHPRDVARSVNAFANADLLLNGPVLELPAGPLSASVRVGAATRDFTSRSQRGIVEQEAAVSRDSATIQLSLDVPIFSQRADSASPLGRLSANANVAAERLSDVGTLRTVGLGLLWIPAEAIGFSASLTREERAPSVEQLGGPIVVTPNVRTFDFSRGEVVDVTRTFGGNPGLQPEDRQVLKLGLTARPVPRADLNLSIDYHASRTDDPIATFPIVTPAIEAAFPGRFTRDAGARLTGIDVRPVNFARAEQQHVRWGVNFSRPLGTVPAWMRNARTRFVGSEAELQRTLPPGAQIVRAEPGSAIARAGETMTSRLQLSLYHTWYLQDDIVTGEDLPVLDLLDGGAVDIRGGRRRHEVEMQASAFKKGLGARLSATWRSASRLQEETAARDLRFASLATVNINLFANLTERFGGAAAPSWLRGTRATLTVNNLFNSRPEVRDAAGLTPLSYQSAYLDPLGRSISFSLRKAF